jgi:hypothetical protein
MGAMDAVKFLAVGMKQQGLLILTSLVVLTDIVCAT